MTDQTFDLDATHPQEGPGRAPRSDEQGSRVPVEGQGSERPANHAGAILNLDAIARLREGIEALARRIETNRPPLGPGAVVGLLRALLAEGGDE